MTNKTAAIKRVAAAAKLAREKAVEADEAAAEVEYQHQLVLAEGERIAAEENAQSFWQRFKKTVGWE